MKMDYYTSILTLAVINFSLASEAPIVKTPFGYLQGMYMTSRSGRLFSSFIGIPYAAPPVGELRFLPPVLPKKWEGVRNATEEKQICSQGKYGGHEDCLYINVFTHHNNSNFLLPVMFYIHGGSFYMGSLSLSITGPDYLLDKDIVLVTVQYRLGPFGFLSTEDSVIPGNMGLKDQVMALRWVQEHINLFGGNPKEVTLFGCSAGGSSVHLHMQSPISQPLFKRGISQSGTAISAFAVMRKGSAKKSALELAKYFNCSSVNSNEILQCLQHKTTKEIEIAVISLQNCRYAMTKSIFRPVIEQLNEFAFITHNPLWTKTYKPWLTGIAANEGLLNIQMKYLNYTIDQIKYNYTEYLPKALLFEDVSSKPHQIATSIKHFYFRNSLTINEMIKSIEEMYTDWWFLWSTEQSIKQHEGSLYYYSYNHQGEHSYVEIYDGIKGFGVSHLDDLISLFKHSLHFQTLNEQDKNISKLIVNLWVNFATYGHPTPLPISSDPQIDEFKDFKWTISNNTSPTLLLIQTHKLSMEEGIYPNRLEFWRELHVMDKVT